MASESVGVDYATVIADLKAKITALQSMVASMEAAWASGALGTGAGVLPEGGGFASTMGGAPFELPVGALLEKNLPDAIKLYLDSVKRKQTNEQIVAALKKAEYQTTGKSLAKAVSNALFRLKATKEVLRFPDGWGLASNYPESVRAKFTASPVAKPSSTKKNSKNRMKRSVGKKAAAKPKAGSTPKPPKSQVASAPSPQPAAEKSPDTTKGVEQRIREIILGNPGTTFQARELSKALNARIQTMGLLLGKLASKGVIQKAGNGFQAAKHVSH